MAESKYRQQCEKYDKPSDMLSTTTLHRLVGEISEKIEKEKISDAN